MVAAQTVKFVGHRRGLAAESATVVAIQAVGHQVHVVVALVVLLSMAALATAFVSAPYYPLAAAMG